MNFTPQELFYALEQEKKHPQTYLLHGEEGYYIDLCVKQIKEKHFTNQTPIFNYVVIEAKDTNIIDIVYQAMQKNLLQTKQMIVIRSLQYLSDLRNTKSQQCFLDYLQAPNPDTIIIFIHPEGLMPKPLMKSIFANQVTIVSCNMIYDNQLKNWIQNYVKQQGYVITAKAIFFLELFIGNQLKLLATEVQKISLQVSKDQVIDEEIIKEHISVNKQYNIFSLQEALKNRDIEKAFQILNCFDQHRYQKLLIPTLGYMFNFFKKLLLLYTTTQHTKIHVSQLLNINTFFVDDYLKAYRHYSFNEVKQNLEYIYESDLKVKGIVYSFISPKLLMQELITKIIFPLEKK